MRDNTTAPKLRVLLIDDDQTCLDVLSQTLNLFDYSNQIFTNPREAIEAFRLKKFDVVVTDYKMPEMTGIEVLKLIQSIDPDTPVIILTGFADTSNAIDAVNTGAHAFFAKPLDTKSFLEALSRIEKELKNLEEKEKSLLKIFLEYRDLEKSFKSLKIS